MTARGRPSERTRVHLALMVAERVCRKDAENADVLREVVELLERPGDVLLGRVALDLGIEARHREAVAGDVALELGDVHPVGREAAERLVEGGGARAHLVDEGGHARPVNRKGTRLNSSTSCAYR